MRLEIFAAWRFLRPPGGQHSLSLLSWISTIGAALGVAALIIAVSVLNGFRDAWRQAIQAASPQIRLELPHTPLSASMRRTLLEALARQPQVAAAAPYIQRQIFLRSPHAFLPASLRGVQPQAEAAVTRLGQQILSGGLWSPWPLAPQNGPPGPPRPPQGLEGLQADARGVLLGRELAVALGVLPGDTLEAVSTAQKLTPLGPLPLVLRLRVLGVFATGLDYVDTLLAVAHHDTVARLYRLGAGSDGLGLRLNTAGVPPPATLAALEGLLPGLQAQPWSAEHSALFRVMRLEKAAVAALLGLMVAVGLFNIMAVLIIQARARQGAIAAWMALGAAPSLVRRTFLLQGACIGFAGTASGSAAGLLACWALSAFPLIPIPQGVFPHLQHLPIALRWTDLAWIGGSAWLVCLAAAPWPMRIASKTPLIHLLRNE